MSGLSYSRVGVDTDAAAKEVGSLARVLAATASLRSGPGQPLGENGYFASAVRLTDELALALCTDGVGSKLLVAEGMGRYDTVGIDCVAMNVNDLICLGAEPLCMVDYVGVESLGTGVLEQIAKGLLEGARQARISIPGGETAQLPEIIKGARPGSGLDLVGTAVGTVRMDRINTGKHVRPGDVIVGLRSSGLHSNGYTLARRALLDPEHGGYGLDTHLDELGRTVGEELLQPTRIYVAEILALLEAGIDCKALVHITGDGLRNLTRVAAPVGFKIDSLPPPPPVFGLIQRAGDVSREEMFRVFNMGIGFCIVLDPADVGRASEIVQKHGAGPHVIGHATDGPAGRIDIDT